MNFGDVKENIKHKYEENEQLENFRKHIEDIYFNSDDITIKNGLFSPSVKVNKRTLLKIIDELIKSNEHLVEIYVKGCFEKELRKKIEEEGSKDNEHFRENE